MEGVMCDTLLDIERNRIEISVLEDLLIGYEDYCSNKDNTIKK